MHAEALQPSSFEARRIAAKCTQVAPAIAPSPSGLTDHEPKRIQTMTDASRVPLDGEIRDGRHILTVRVYYEDTDFTGIVYHANYLRYMERGRTNYLRLIGADHRALFEATEKEAPGFAFVVRSMTIDFLKPARMDDVLEIVTEPEEVKGASITLHQRVNARRGASGRGERARRLHQRRPGAADPEAAAHRHEGRSGSGRSRGLAGDCESGGAARATCIYGLMMIRSDFALFDTPIGCCGIVWSERGIAGVQLPEASAQATRNRILRRFPGA